MIVGEAVVGITGVMRKSTSSKYLRQAQRSWLCASLKRPQSRVRRVVQPVVSGQPGHGRPGQRARMQDLQSDFHVRICRVDGFLRGREPGAAAGFGLVRAPGGARFNVKNRGGGIRR